MPETNIAQEISRITTARNSIRTKLSGMGIALSTDDITTLASRVDSIADRGAIAANVQVGESYTIPQGYHNGSGTVTGVQGSGQFLLQAKGPITPTKNQQNITSDSGYYGLSAVTIDPIPDAYQDVSSVTASAADVLATKVYVDSSGALVTGTMVNNGAVNTSLSTATTSYTIPSGFHNGNGKVSITTEEKSVTPATAVQSVVPSSGKVLSKVTVAAIPSKFADTTGDDVVAANILDGKKAHSYNSTTGAAVAVVGTMTNNGAVSATIDTETTSYTVPTGYHNGSGTVSLVTETKSVTPSASAVTVTPSSGKVLSSVTVGAIPSPYFDVSGVTATASQVLAGTSFITSAGTLTSGTMTDQGTKTTTLTVSTTSYTIPKGYHSGSGKVSIVTESKNATPASTAQTITPSTGKVLSSVVVAAIPSPYFDVSDVTAVASQVLAGTSFITSAGALTSGTMVDQGTKTTTLTVATTSYTIPEGYHNGSGKVSIVTESKNATPSTASQTISPSTGKVLSSVVVAAIPSAYQNVTNVDAAAGDVLEGKIIVASDGTEVTGSMPNNGAVSHSLDATTGNQSYTVPSGYHDGTGAVTITLESKNATPASSTQTITPTTGKVLSSVTVAAIPSPYFDVSGVTASAANVLTGTSFVTSSGVLTAGSMTNRGAVNTSLNTTTTSYTIPAGYHNGSGKVSITTETKSATPATTSQTISPTSGKVLSSVTVNAIPSKFGDTTGDDAIAANLLYGVKAHTISGGAAVQITGSMPNNGAIAGSIDGLTTMSYAVASGYTSGGTVTLTNDIETALAAI